MITEVKNKCYFKCGGRIYHPTNYDRTITDRSTYQDTYNSLAGVYNYPTNGVRGLDLSGNQEKELVVNNKTFRPFFRYAPIT